MLLLFRVCFKLANLLSPQPYRGLLIVDYVGMPMRYSSEASVMIVYDSVLCPLANSDVIAVKHASAADVI